MKPYGDKADIVIDKALTDLVGWARRHGYDPHGNGCEFLDIVIEYVTDSMDEPDDYDFVKYTRLKSCASFGGKHNRRA